MEERAGDFGPLKSVATLNWQLAMTLAVSVAQLQPLIVGLVYR